MEWIFFEGSEHWSDGEHTIFCHAREDGSVFFRLNWKMDFATLAEAKAAAPDFHFSYPDGR